MAPKGSARRRCAARPQVGGGDLVPALDDGVRPDRAGGTARACAPAPPARARWCPARPSCRRCARRTPCRVSHSASTSPVGPAPTISTLALDTRASAPRSPGAGGRHLQLGAAHRRADGRACQAALRGFDAVPRASAVTPLRAAGARHAKPAHHYGTRARAAKPVRVPDWRPNYSYAAVRPAPTSRPKGSRPSSGVLPRLQHR